MSRLIALSMHLRFTIMANRILHLFRLRGLIGNYDAKVGFTVVGALFVLSKKLLFHLIYVGILLAIGAVVAAAVSHGGVVNLMGTTGDAFDYITANAVVTYAFSAWFVISIIGAPGMATSIGSLNHENDKMMIDYMKADPTQYAKARIFSDLLGCLALLAPTFALGLLFTDYGLSALVNLLALFVMAKLMGEAINLWMFKKWGINFGYMKPSVILLAFVYPGAVILPYVLAMHGITVLYSNVLWSVIPLLIAVPEIMYIHRYLQHKEFIIDRVNYMTNFTKKAEKWGNNAGGASIAIDKVTISDNSFDNKEGFAYLNAIFFDRHKSSLNKKLIKRCGGVLIPLVAAIIFAVVMFILYGHMPNGFDGEFGLAGLFGNASILLFVVYFISMGRSITASVYTNCDIQMLNYKYYRQPSTIFASFKARVKVILKYNFIITTVGSVSFIGTTWLFFGYQLWLYNLLLFVALTFTGIFFAVSDLFLYYIIQPYDADGNAKSFLNTVITQGIYWISWISAFNAPFAIRPYTIAIVVGTVVYVVVGTVLLFKLAPARFKLR